MKNPARRLWSAPLLALAAASCGRPGALPALAPTVTQTIVVTPTPTPTATPPPPTLPSADGTLVIGPRTGQGTLDLGTTTATGTESLVVDATCSGGGQLAVVLASGTDSRPDTLTCTGQPLAAQAFPAYEFTGTVDVSVEGLANQRWTVLVGRRPQ